MSKTEAERIIVVSLFVMLASTIGSKLASGKKDKEAKKHYATRLAGGFLTMLFASLMAEVAPEPGALLAMGTASYAFLHDGLPAINGKYQNTKPALKFPENFNEPYPGGLPRMESLTPAEVEALHRMAPGSYRPPSPTTLGGQLA